MQQPQQYDNLDHDDGKQSLNEDDNEDDDEAAQRVQVNVTTRTVLPTTWQTKVRGGGSAQETILLFPFLF